MTTTFDPAKHPRTSTGQWAVKPATAPTALPDLLRQAADALDADNTTGVSLHAVLAALAGLPATVLVGDDLVPMTTAQASAVRERCRDGWNAPLQARTRDDGALVLLVRDVRPNNPRTPPTVSVFVTDAHNDMLPNETGLDVTRLDGWDAISDAVRQSMRGARLLPVNRQLDDDQVAVGEEHQAPTHLTIGYIAVSPVTVHLTFGDRSEASWEKAFTQARREIHDYRAWATADVYAFEVLDRAGQPAATGAGFFDADDAYAAAGAARTQHRAA
ncbi:MAG: hypothetical protein QG597_4013 [Actinomycetota bacterium]|jgi:hypothetical protein|nr:hypothetical protein [Actinomycetota bacterium]